MQAVEYLKQVKALIENPENWAKDNFARKSNGNATRINSHEACSWCLIGALIKVSDKNNGKIQDNEKLHDVVQTDYEFIKAVETLFFEISPSSCNGYTHDMKIAYLADFNDGDVGGPGHHDNVLDLLDSAIDTLNAK